MALNGGNQVISLARNVGYVLNVIQNAKLVAFVVKRYAIRNAKKGRTQYAVKMEHYSVRKGVGGSPLLFVKGIHHN